VTAFGEIFLEYFWNILKKVFEYVYIIFIKIFNTILLRFMLKIWQKIFLRLTHLKQNLTKILSNLTKNVFEFSLFHTFEQQ